MITKLKIYQFRNYKDMTTINTNSRRVVFTGLNGSGKTSLLEAIYMLCIGSSFKEHKDMVIAHKGFNQFSLVSYHKIDEYNAEKVLLVFDDGVKQIKLNDENIKERKELLKRYPCFIFSYEDIELSYGSQEIRRRFFDQLISFIDLEYVDLLRQYKKVVRERNIILKAMQNSNADLLNSYTKKMIELGMALGKKRDKYLIEFEKELNPLLKEVFISSIKIELEKSWKGSSVSEIEAFIESKKDIDINRGVTLYGPHKDLIFFKEDEIDVAPYWSIGQKRILALVLKIAASNFISKNHKRKPILLIDDVLLELDYKQQAKILSLLTNYEQIFFTFLPKHNLVDKNEDTLVYNIDSGVLSLVEE